MKGLARAIARPVPTVREGWFRTRRGRTLCASEGAAMDGSFWVGIGVFVAIAAVTVLVLVILRVSGKRLGLEPPGSHEARIEAQRLKEQSLRDGWVP